MGSEEGEETDSAFYSCCSEASMSSHMDDQGQAADSAGSQGRVLPPAAPGTYASELLSLLGVLLPPDSLVPIYRYEIVHHKNERAWGHAPIKAVLPYELAVWVHIYLQHFWERLPHGEECNHLLCRRDGLAMDTEDLRRMWMKVQGQFDAPWDHIPPSIMRRVHVIDELVNLADAIARSGHDTTHGHAHLMGNSPTASKAWIENYANGDAWLLLGQGAIDELTQWRHGVHSDWDNVNAAWEQVVDD